MIAQSLIDSSYLARYVLLNAVGITDYKIFPARAIQNSPPTFYFPEPANEDPVQSDLLDVVPDGRYPDEKLDHFLEKIGTTAFIIIKEDKLILENYYNGYDHAAICTSFSTVKSFVSALIGIAIHEGLIGRLDDSIVHYLPELIAPHWPAITIRHLVSMSSGLQYNQRGFLPWQDEPHIYYSLDLRGLARQARQAARRAVSLRQL